MRETSFLLAAHPDREMPAYDGVWAFHESKQLVSASRRIVAA
jgi:hypothetical protein